MRNSVSGQGKRGVGKGMMKEGMKDIRYPDRQTYKFNTYDVPIKDKSQKFSLKKIVMSKF